MSSPLDGLEDWQLTDDEYYFGDALYDGSLSGGGTQSVADPGGTFGSGLPDFGVDLEKYYPLVSDLSGVIGDLFGSTAPNPDPRSPSNRPPTQSPVVYRPRTDTPVYSPVNGSLRQIPKVYWILGAMFLILATGRR